MLVALVEVMLAVAMLIRMPLFVVAFINVEKRK